LLVYMSSFFIKSHRQQFERKGVLFLKIS